MRPARWVTANALALLTAVASVAPATAAPAPSGDALGVYTGTLDVAQLALLRAAGVDSDEIAPTPVAENRVAVETILGRRQAERLIKAGVPLAAKRTTTTMRARAAADPTVFRRYDAPGGIRAELATTTAQFPQLTKLVTIGTTLRGVPIQAVKVTTNARTVSDGARPAVLYFSAQHAREWITPEMNRRLMHYVLDGYGKDATLTKLVDTTELWFLPVANPDGYDFSFTEGNRLWRKNLRDNNGDGQLTNGDGVDLNRNFAEKWGYDNEGSSDDPSSETYRGTGPESEPETRALDALFSRVGFEFVVNYHSAAEMLLYGVGWQASTPSPDDQIGITLAGDDAHSAIPGYNPGVSSQLYTSNGDTDTHAQVRTGAIGFSPEMSTCETVSAIDSTDKWEPADCPSRFNFPDDEKLIQNEFLKNVPFALSLARSAADPANPVSSVGRTVSDFQSDPFDSSYGTSQQVAVTAKRSLSGAQLQYTINNGPAQSAPATPWRGGQKYGAGFDKYYAELRGTVPKQKSGDKVTVWFTASGGRSSTPFTYTVADHIGSDVLVLAAEDVTGISPANTDGATAARYADEHVDALRAAGYSADVYDLDTHARKAPHPLGVLSHYKAVLWETGDDVVPRAAGQPGGTTTRAAFETEMAVRDYLNEGGKLLYSGQYAGLAQAAGTYAFKPEGTGECTSATDPTCVPMSNDFEQYWLGADRYLDNGVTTALTGTAGKFAGFAAPAGNQAHTATLVTTSSSLPPAQFPQFSSAAPVKWQQTGKPPYEPFDGAWYLWSGQANASYKRLTRTVDLAAAKAAHLRFSTSFDTEADWDYLFVEAHVVGSDNWTTLPDAGGLTSTATGESCETGLAGLHPFLNHYWGADCSPTGTTGSWNAASGSSGGWKEFDADLSAYAGKQVEVSITYSSDWVNQGLGVFLDNVRVEANGVNTAQTSFESDLGGWAVAGPPAGSGTNGTDWSRSQKAFESGAGTTTAATVYLGFGLERLAPADRNDLVARAMHHLCD